MQIVLNRHRTRAAPRRDPQMVLTKLRSDRFGDKLEQTHKRDTAFLLLWQSMSGGKPKDAA